MNVRTSLAHWRRYTVFPVVLVNRAEISTSPLLKRYAARSVVTGLCVAASLGANESVADEGHLAASSTTSTMAPQARAIAVADIRARYGGRLDVMSE